MYAQCIYNLARPKGHLARPKGHKGRDHKKEGKTTPFESFLSFLIVFYKGARRLTLQMKINIENKQKPHATTLEETPLNYTRKLGSNRGKTRLWLEGNILSAKGWECGNRFDVILIDGVLKYAKTPDGKRKVAGKPGRPIIDTNTDKISSTLNTEPGTKVGVTVLTTSITVQSL